MWALSVVRLVLAILAMWGRRWAYVAFMILGLLYFPLKSSFTFDPHFPCELTLGLPLAIHSLRNFPHIVLFAVGFVLTAAQFRLSHWLDYAWSAAIILTVGALVEFLEGITRTANCRVRDLIPDAVGALIGAFIVMVLYKIGWRPKPRWCVWCR